MNILDQIYEHAKSNPQRVAFPECTEEKILRAARECADKGYCHPLPCRQYCRGEGRRGAVRHLA